VQHFTVVTKLNDDTSWLMAALYSTVAMTLTVTITQYYNNDSDGHGHSNGNGNGTCVTEPCTSVRQRRMGSSVRILLGVWTE